MISQNLTELSLDKDMLKTLLPELELDEMNQEEIIEALVQKMTVMKAQIENYLRNEIIDRALWRAGARNPIAARALMNLAHITTDKLQKTSNSELSELQSAIDDLKQNEGYLFYTQNLDTPQLSGMMLQNENAQAQDAFVSGFLKR